eukprot:TRINITY_DN11590_c0_g2_i1.p3 TRINITY_DN11590_c0_g2~~TRINITY_DN11590_c0_g2_i1.p3  ORF type:complete len:111 (-),score=32.00 TRINITY_DN11590_c0_g2_i1:50-382(-)
MLLEKSKRLREVCQKKTMMHKENIKDNKSRNLLYKVQSRKTCSEIQSIQNNLKKLTVETRNSLVHSTISNSKSKRLIPNSRLKQGNAGAPKYSTRSRLEILSKKKPVLKK